MSDDYPDDDTTGGDLELDARSLRVWVEPADPAEPQGDLVLVITDGDSTVRVTAGIGSGRQLAVYGVQRLEGGAQQYMVALRMREQRDHPTVHGPLNGP